MKKLYIILIAVSISALLLPGCKKVLDKQPQTTLTPTEVFSDSLVTVFYLNTLYTNNLPTWGSNSGGAIGSSGSLTEENTGGSPYTSGAVTIETVGDISTSNNNSNSYAKIRNINVFIAGMQTSPIATPTKKRFIAQALFWRAYRYFELVKIYGGVPLETAPLPVVGTAAKLAADLPRSSTTQTWAQIEADLDSAIASLPAVWPSAADYGRITKGAAQAFKGRTLLTWASPQFNPSNDVTRWQTALTACNAAITTLSAAGYGLYPKEDVTMWTTEGPGSPGKPANVEAVMVTEYTSTNTSNSSSNGYTSGNIPKALGGGGGNNPTWDEVQAFPMADGNKPTTASSAYPYNPKLFFDNRDPRFYQTIAYNGCSWPLEGNALNRLWTYFYYSNAAGTGANTTETGGSSTTGFYCRKAVDPNISQANLPYSGTDWQEIRYAEVILNRAECAAATGDLITAYSDLEAIRKRAGIIAGSAGLYGLQAGMTQSQMIDAIMYERQIEFAYEGKRYWDLRRRMLLESTLNGKKRQGFTITLNNTGTSKDYLNVVQSNGLTMRDNLATTSLDNVYLTYFNGTVALPNGETTKIIDTSPIAFQTADYFFGIPTAALQNNTGLLQNNTWGGPFDPLK
jgi:hypothetical protein